MKKLLSLLLALILIIPVCIPMSVDAAYTGEEECFKSQYMIGNIDGDQKVSAGDALMALQHAVGKIVLTRTKPSLIDINEDSEVNVSDALLVLQMAVGKIDFYSYRTSFPNAEIDSAALAEMIKIGKAKFFDGSGNETTELTISEGCSVKTSDYTYVFSYINKYMDVPGWSVTVIEDYNKIKYAKLYKKILGYPLVSMPNTFYGTSIEISPVIPDTVINMYRTFNYCGQFRYIDKIPNSVTLMEGTFWGCHMLINPPAIPDSVINMDDTFRECEYVICKKIPDSVISMRGTFSHCKYVEDFPELPNNVTDISMLFSFCSLLTEAPVIPQSVSKMEGTFSNTALKKGADIPNGVTDISNIYEDCVNLTEVPPIPESVKNMTAAFIDCTSLEIPPAIPENITRLLKVFSGCTNLKSAPVINSNITSLSSTFTGCQSLTGTIEINSKNLDSYNNCFKDACTGPDCKVILVGTCDKLNELSKQNENVFVEE